MNIAIITAMPEESRTILKKGGQVEKFILGGRTACRCRIAGHDITLVESGMGMLNAGWAATALAAEAPDLLVSAGFGGGVLPGLKVGDTVVAERLLHWTGRAFEEVEARFCGPGVIDDAPSMLRGCFITGDGILDKRQLAEILPNGVNRPVVEMESAAVARVAAEHGIPFLGVRAVSDPWNEELGFSINEFCDEGMRIRPLKVLATVIRRPRIIPQLLRLARNSRIAAKELGMTLERLLGSL